MVEQVQSRFDMDQVCDDARTIIAVLERHDETTWSSHIAHTLTGSSIEDIAPPLRHELCGLRRTPLARTLGLEHRLDALIALMDEALVPYGYQPER